MLTCIFLILGNICLIDDKLIVLMSLSQKWEDLVALIGMVRSNLTVITNSFLIYLFLIPLSICFGCVKFLLLIIYFGLLFLLHGFASL